jgi:phosphate transport system substrate-binding protein
MKKMISKRADLFSSKMCRVLTIATVVGSILISPFNQSLVFSAESTTTPSAPAAETTSTTNKTTLKVVLKPLPIKTQHIKQPVVTKKPVTQTQIKKNSKDNRRNNKNTPPNRWIDPATNLSGKVKVSTTAAMKPMVQELIKNFNKKYKKVTVSVFGGQAGIGIYDVSNKKADIGLVARDLTRDEINNGLSNSKVGIDVIALVVNPKNRIQNLSTSDVFNIYTRNITDWRDIRGGANSQISFNTYSSSVGLSNLFDSVFMHGQRLSDKVAIHSTTGSMLNTIKQKSNAIGYASMSDIKKGLNILSINGIAPNGQNIRSGRYPFTRNINMVYKNNKSAAANAFLQFAMSSDGQKIINKHFYQAR